MDASTTALNQDFSPAREAWRMFLRNKAAVFGLILFSAVLVFAIVGPYLYDVDPFKIVWRHSLRRAPIPIECQLEPII